VIIERRHHSRHIHGPELSVIVGGLAGAAIANDISNGDPAATIGGAVIGTVVGKVLSY
jgi:outer membrane lipoprotein SlyB